MQSSFASTSNSSSRAAASSSSARQRSFASLSSSPTRPLGMDEAQKAAQRSQAAAVAVAAARAAASGAVRPEAVPLISNVEGLQSWMHDESGTLSVAAGRGMDVAGSGSGSTRSERASSSTLPASSPQSAGTNQQGKKRRTPSASPEMEKQADDVGDASGVTSDAQAKSKRAAQNRAAQRAFRERRDRYIKELEERLLHFDPALIYAHTASHSLAAYEAYSHSLFSAASQLQDQLRAAGLQPNVDLRAPLGPPPAIPPNVASLARGVVERIRSAAKGEAVEGTPLKKQRRTKKEVAASSQTPLQGPALRSPNGTGAAAALGVPLPSALQKSAPAWIGALPSPHAHTSSGAAPSSATLPSSKQRA